MNRTSDGKMMKKKNTESASKEMELCVCVVCIVYKISIYHIVK